MMMFDPDSTDRNLNNGRQARSYRVIFLWIGTFS